MAQRKNEDYLPEGADADIRLAMHEMALGKRRFFGSADERLYLFEKMTKDEASMRELVCLSYLRGMITKEMYLDFLQIEKDCAECDEEESDGEDDWDSPLYPEGFPF